jgi:hypothetical protein
MGAIRILVERPHPQGAYMAGNVIAWRDGVVDDGIGADEADLGICFLSLTIPGWDLRFGVRRF